MGTAINPAQMIPQFVEYSMDLAIAQGLAQSMASRTDEESHIGCGLHVLAA
jgi:hypothetical protein